MKLFVWKRVEIEGKTVSFCLTTVKELTESELSVVEDVYRAVEKIGCLCALGDEIVLREQYSNQPRNEKVHVLIQPVKGRHGTLVVPNLWRPGWDPEIGSSYANPGYLWRGDERVVFRVIE